MRQPVSFRVFVAAGFTLGIFALGTMVLRLAALESPTADLAAGAPKPREPARTWHLVDGKHWQIVSDFREPTEVTDARENNRGACGPGMIQVKGKMKVDPPRLPGEPPQTIEELQKTTCTNWINKEYPERCQTFDRDAWLKIAAPLPTRDMDFCMDRYEYPNQKGEYPVIFVAWPEAVNLCEQMGKRLCNEDEWTFACEGEEATPYPYGYERSPDKCVSDRTWRPYNGKAMTERGSPTAMMEMDRLWQGFASGEQNCVSVFGVHDMTGNVDEWTVSHNEYERPSILKGGYWGPVRTRCRPSTRSHGKNHAFYQQSFRCCADVGKEVKPPYDPPGGAARSGGGAFD
ncbi:MAG: SUMF1/EgtB/PvdO family nonheme iron enzyme [Polyangiaceae bacterium]